MVDFGGAEVAGVDFDVGSPVKAGELTGEVEEFAD